MSNGQFDYGYSPKLHSTHGWTIGGTHKAWYRVREQDYPTINRERLYVQCNCNLGYDHEASYADNPSYEAATAALSPQPRTRKHKADDAKSENNK